MLLLDPNTLNPAVMHAHRMDRAVAEGSGSVVVGHLGLLGGSKPSTREPGPGHAPGHRHSVAHMGLREGWQHGPNPPAWPLNISRGPEQSQPGSA